MTIPVIVVHGGAWSIPDDRVESSKKGVKQAVQKGYQCMLEGQSAVDAVEVAVRILEDDPIFLAGQSHRIHYGQLGLLFVFLSFLYSDDCYDKVHTVTFCRCTNYYQYTANISSFKFFTKKNIFPLSHTQIQIFSYTILCY